MTDNNWNPRTVFQYVDNDILAWIIIITCILMTLGYAFIIFKTWLPPIRNADPGAAGALISMASLFLLCATGYTTIALAGWFPKVAFVIRVTILVGHCIAILWFIKSKHWKEFKLIGKYDSLGRAVAIDLSNPNKLDVEILREARERFALTRWSDLAIVVSPLVAAPLDELVKQNDYQIK